MAHILVVDDNIICRCALRATLETLTHRVREARNGFDAVAACLCEMPDLVLLDILMPEKDGIETLLHLRQLAPALPIVMISDGGAIHFDAIFDIVGMMGANAILRKPFSQDELLAKLAAVLSDAATRSGPEPAALTLPPPSA